jgi:four helix bundle protein
MAEIKSYKDLHAWQVGMDTMTMTDEITATFPREERYGLTSQMRRASLSIPSNVAEGDGMAMPRWSLRYIMTAIGSSLELETQLEAAIRLNYLSRDGAQPLASSIDRVQKLLYGMRREKLHRLGITFAGAGVLLLAIVRTLG